MDRSSLEINIEPFVYWIKERENIRLKRVAGARPPWTSDPILANYRFCNVRREDDKVTIWIRENVREPYADHPYLWWMLCAARQINWPESLAECIAQGAWPDNPKFRPENMTEVLTARKERGEKVFTGAYIIRGVYYTSKTQGVSECVLGPLWKRREIITDKSVMKQTLQLAHKTLLEFDYWGPFMAYQAIVDMRFCPSLLANAPDREIWAAAGPGTLKGLNYIYGRGHKETVSQQRALEEIREIEPILRSTGVDFDFSDIPNILCEGSKLVKMRRGEGHLRATYKGGTL